jgi:hypothetical protein
MKCIIISLLTIYILFDFSNSSSTYSNSKFSNSQALLSNFEIREILKCFGDLNLEEGCIICRYITQKIYKVVEITSMCPDVVESKLKFQRERNWNPDPQLLNKWTVLFNLQKDYLTRIKPAFDGMKNYNEIFKAKINKQRIEKENLNNLIQFQNKMNSDLSHDEKIKRTEFDVDDLHCDDEELKENSNKIKEKDLLKIKNMNLNTAKDCKNIFIYLLLNYLFIFYLLLLLFI